MLVSTILLSSLSTLAAGKSFQVVVGSGGLKFAPEMVMAASGDTINFMIHKTHNVAQSTFDSPCKPSGDNAIFSGNEAQSFAVTINGTDPVWFYCSTPGHCSAGMVFAVNPTSTQTIDAFQKNAGSGGEGTEPSKVQGGVVNGQGSSGGASNSTTSAMSSGAAMSTSASGGSGGSATMSGGASMTSSGGSGSSMAPSSSGGSSSSGSSNAAAGANSGQPLGYILAGLLGAVNMIL